MPELIGRSEALANIREQIAVAAGFDEPVLILGETGTGKELIARAIHRGGARARALLFVVNCGGLNEDMLMAELFGHRAGAFTGARRDRTGRILAASGSSLLLDEVSETPQSFQVALLRAIEHHEVQPVGSDDAVTGIDVRFLATCNRGLDELAESRGFRPDLWYRLAAFVIYVPPLRGRTEDVAPLARHFLERFTRRYGGRPVFTGAALALLARHDFPGNCRELRQVVLRAFARARGERVSAADVDAALLHSSVPAPGRCDTRSRAAPSALHDVLRDHIEHVLTASSFNRSEAARRLEIPRSTLQHYLGKYSIDPASARV